LALTYNVFSRGREKWIAPPLCRVKDAARRLATRGAAEGAASASVTAEKGGHKKLPASVGKSGKFSA